MAFPSAKELQRARKKLQIAEGFLVLPPDADELDRFRFNICQEILKYAQSKDLNTVGMARFLEIPKSDVSRIFNHRISRFSTDKLLRLYSKIKPNYRLKVA